MTWAILTGEYPPQRGGVSDYTRLVALGLAAAGDPVHVFAPEISEPTPPEAGVKIHRLPGRFGPSALAQLGNELNRLPPPVRILVQYVPHAYGFKAMNVPFCLWLLRRRQPVWSFYHEVAYPFGRNQPLKLNALAAVTRAMANIVAHASERVYISTPFWRQWLPKPAVWMPIPSTVDTSADPAAVQFVRKSLSPGGGEVWVGHFGTYGHHLAPLLRAILAPLLRDNPNLRVLLLGGGGREFASAFERDHPPFAGRLHAPGVLPGGRLAVHLAACDAIVQPYPDGVTARRTSVMASLALGLPIVTTEGYLTEPVWKESGAVAIVPAKREGEFVFSVQSLLADPVRRAQLGLAAAKLYRERFAIENTIRELRS